MAFTGKATYSAGVNLPELAEDVSDLIGIISPYETPLLDALGDPMRAAHSTYHQWLEDELLPNKDSIDDDSIVNPTTDTQFDAAHGSRFRIGDQIQIEGLRELMLVTNVGGNTLTVVRGDAAQPPVAVANASNLIYRIMTFAPQAAEALYEIAGWFGLRPGTAQAAYGVEDISDATPLHLLSAYRVLAMVFGALGGTETAKKTYAQKRDYYLGLYKEARGRARITLDVEHDGVMEKIILGGCVRLIRE